MREYNRKQAIRSLEDSAKRVDKLSCELDYLCNSLMLIRISLEDKAFNEFVIASALSAIEAHIERLEADAEVIADNLNAGIVNSIA